MGIAPVFWRGDAKIVGPRPHVPQAPSQTMAMQQHQQQLAQQQQQSALGMPQTSEAQISCSSSRRSCPPR